MKKLVLALCLSLLVPALAQAAIMTYDIGGVLTHVAGNLTYGLAPGQAYTGWFSYSTDKVLYDSGSFGAAQYSTPLTFEVTAGGKTYTSNGLTKYMDSTLVASVVTVGDHTSIRASGGASASTDPWNMYIERLTYEISLNNGSKDFPPSSFCFSYALVEDFDGKIQENYAMVEGSLATCTQRAEPTPLPAAVWLLGSGLGLAGLRRWRKKA